MFCLIPNGLKGTFLLYLHKLYAYRLEDIWKKQSCGLRPSCGLKKIVCEKSKSTNLNPYIINWIISFLGNRKKRVVVDGKITDYVDINKGAPQGTVLGPLLFSLMVNDIKLVDSNNRISKCDDDFTISVPGNLIQRLQKLSILRAGQPTIGCHWICQRRGKCY